MKPVLVSASAGSGKTFRLAEALREALTRAVDPIPPESVLATTFTNKAAAELQERSRLHLIAAGRVEDAQRLGAARIGTVNAVCGRLVADFAFELGRPPEQRVLDEGLAQVALRRALSAVRTLQESLEIAELRRRLNQFDLTGAIEQVIAQARANDISASRFEECAARSQREVLALLPPVAPDAEPIDAAFRDALHELDAWFAAGKDPTVGNEKPRARVAKAWSQARRGFDVPWDEWAYLASLKVTKATRPLGEKLSVAAQRYVEHPRFHADLARAIELVFQLAARGERAYAEYKRAAGAVDFVDQEALAYRLLERPDVQERLRDELRLVLVDEFQDTSPLQLGIFTRLAALVPETLWVGDQKQSIFGFRGADAELMEAAIAGLVADGREDTLSKSYRSRPELVRRTSDLFAAAFARDAVPPERVRLEPALAEEPQGLGPIAERWRLASGSLREDQWALAVALRALLADPESRVRDRATGEARPVRAGDVAVLCRRRAASRAVATALQAHGIPAVLPRAGLMKTAEGQLALAGLRLWADPRDTLAAATVARLVELPPDGDEWLETALAFPRAERFFTLPRIARLIDVRKASDGAGPLAALEAVFVTLDVAGSCADWGATEQRLANLDALRAHAVQFTETCLTDGSGATAAGLVEYLERLMDDDADDQAVLSTSDAISVSTWHAAKGLEWPIVVLFQIDATDRMATVFGVSVAREADRFDWRAPLAGRWVRCWPQIFHPMRTTTALHERLRSNEIALARQAKEDREQRRLLYVGWTRARDRVVLAGRRNKLLDGILGSLRNREGELLLDDPEEGPASWAGTQVELRHRAASVEIPLPPEAAPGSTFAASGPRALPAKSFSPSDAGGDAESTVAESVEDLGERLPVHGSWDERAMGEAFHRFFAADTGGLAPAERLDIARRLLETWRVQNAIDPAALVAAADRLRGFLDRRYPDALWHREWPLRARVAEGTELRGNADLVLETAEGFVVVDHKAFAGQEQSVIVRAQGYAGQLAAYAGALAAASGKPALALWIHLPLAGRLIEIRRH